MTSSKVISILSKKKSSIEGEKKLEVLEKLVDAGLSLSDENSYEVLLEKMTEYGLEIGSCEGISIYRVKDNYIKFINSRNRVLEDRTKADTKTKSSFLGDMIPIDSETISGYCASTGEIVLIDDVYKLEDDSPFRFNPSYDNMVNYRSCSMVVIPMLDTKGNVLGVMQFINYLVDGHVMPFPNDLVQYLKALANQAGLVLRNLLYADDLRSSREEAVKNFVTTSEYHDKDTGGHIDRMSRYSELLFKIVGKNEEDCAKIRFASMLHDIGKISTPDRVLKKPGSLNDEEWTIMKKHANAGYEMLCDSSCEYLKMGAVIALTHHERWDGSGYPRGLKGEEIPLEGRVVALADVFDALCSKRCYKDAWPLTKVIGLIEDASGSHFDPALVKVFVDNIDAFLEIKATFPTGPVNKEQYKDENKVNLTAKVS